MGRPEGFHGRAGSDIIGGEPCVMAGFHWRKRPLKRRLGHSVTRKIYATPNGQDIWVIKRGRSLDFLHKTADAIPVTGNLGQQQSLLML